MKGIILAGGAGTRLHPITKVTSKQLLPVYNKPMIFYPLETLLKAGITDILIIIAPENAGDFVRLLGSGKEFGAKFTYEVQEKPEGLAQAFIIGASFIGNDSVAMILGDNLFEDDFSEAVKNFKSGASIFLKDVPDPQRFGIAEIDADLNVLSVEEKPKIPKSKYAITGLYMYDNTVVEKAKNITPSARGELEITGLHDMYLKEGNLNAVILKGKWLDTGTFESLHEASCFAREKALKQSHLQVTEMRIKERLV
ncbi:spore coat protein [Candidatus Peregrinibacteria bacterium CG_4_10_14_0_2_um_filter_43_11]|nr:MAG: spore coat protein [Candidatus Peregrinibacteria bacterium CG_4_10_14_0_2_um_filter_43_11]